MNTREKELTVLAAMMDRRMAELSLSYRTERRHRLKDAACIIVGTHSGDARAAHDALMQEGRELTDQVAAAERARDWRRVADAIGRQVWLADVADMLLELVVADGQTVEPVGGEA